MKIILPYYGLVIESKAYLDMWRVYRVNPNKKPGYNTLIERLLGNWRFWLIYFKMKYFLPLFPILLLYKRECFLFWLRYGTYVLILGYIDLFLVHHIYAVKRVQETLWPVNFSIIGNNYQHC